MSDDVTPELPLEQRRRIALGQSQPAFNADQEASAAAARQRKNLAAVAGRRGLDPTGAPIQPKRSRR